MASTAPDRRPEAAIGEVVETPPSGREGSGMGGHELHRQVVRGVASSRHAWSRSGGTLGEP